jgi:hypothetical protein
MKIYAYIMTHDDGAAPCVKNGVLTIAICKLTIRKVAQERDILVDIGGDKLGRGRLIYAAKVTSTEDEGYYDNERNGNRLDCIYEPDDDGNPVHRGEGFDHYDPDHTKVFFHHDVSKNWKNARVLKSTDFRYLGGEGFPYQEALFCYDNLRALIEMHRTNIPQPGMECLVIDEKRPEWIDIHELIDELWRKFRSVPGEKASHYEKDPQPEKWVSWNKAVKAWRKANPFDWERFGFTSRKASEAPSQYRRVSQGIGPGIHMKVTANHCLTFAQ